jgi:hypothetical protein
VTQRGRCAALTTIKCAKNSPGTGSRDCVSIHKACRAFQHVVGLIIALPADYSRRKEAHREID